MKIKAHKAKINPQHRIIISDCYLVIGQIRNDITGFYERKQELIFLDGKTQHKNAEIKFLEKYPTGQIIKVVYQ